MSTCALTWEVCPRTADDKADRYCPLWREDWWESAVTGERTLRKQCGVPMLFETLGNISKTAEVGMQEASRAATVLFDARAAIAINRNTEEAIDRLDHHGVG